MKIGLNKLRSASEKSHHSRFVEVEKMRIMIQNEKNRISIGIVLFFVLELIVILLSLYFGVLNMALAFIFILVAGFIGACIGIIIYIKKTDMTNSKNNKKVFSVLGSLCGGSGALGYICGRIIINRISLNDTLVYIMLVVSAVLLSFFFMMGIYTIPQYVEPILCKFRINGRVGSTKNIDFVKEHKSKTDVIMSFNKGLNISEIEKSNNIALSEEQIKDIIDDYLENRNNIEKYKIGGSKGVDIYEFCISPKTRAEITEYVGLTNNYYCHKKYIKPLVDKNLLCLTIPESPSSPKQRFYANI